MFKKLCLGLGVLLVLVCILLAALVYWAQAFFPDDSAIEKLRASQSQDLSYLRNSIPQTRGKILAVVTSTRELPGQNKPTGYELSELARAYWVFTANGFQVDVASPLGDEPYALLDFDDMAEFDYAFLNDPVAQQKIKHTIMIDQINAADYQAVYFVGGKGAMFDFPNNLSIQALIKYFVDNKKIIAAVCHGPAALVNVTDSNGDWLFAQKSMTAFTNTEELLLIPDADKLFPFLLQSRLEQQGAVFSSGHDYLEHLVIDDGLITGQNPWSVWRLAEETIKQLGYEPLPRELTSEEQTVDLLEIYQDQGLDAAEKQVLNHHLSYNGLLLLMHSMVAGLKGDLGDSIGLIILADSVRVKITAN
jgi:putative intracellular protease/amidase